MSMSKTLEGIIKTREGVRNDDWGCYQADKLTLEAIFKYETEELGNTDIIDFICEEYNYKVETYKDLEKLLNKHNPLAKTWYGLWLTDLDGVRDIYTSKNEEEIEITAYKVDIEKGLIISDLDKDGILIAIPERKRNYYIRNFSYKK